MDRSARLQSAKHWLGTYKGQSVIKGYSKWYGVSRVCAILELRMLGLSIDEERLEEARRAERARAEARAAMKQRRRERDDLDPGLDECSDDLFCFIAGYTPGGFPYGVTWDEVDEEPPWNDGH
jgi:hypothetical protein